MKRAGFNMIELVFVVTIVGVLTAVAVPRFVMGREDACYAKLKADLSETQTTLTRQYTKAFLQGKSISTDDLKSILDSLANAGGDKCYFSIGTVNVNNGVINGNITAHIRSNTLAMEVKNENNVTGASTGATSQPIITCDLDKEICQKITGKVAK